MSRLLVVVIVLIAGVPCLAQNPYPPDNNGLGNNPMAPATPGNYYQPPPAVPRVDPPVATRPESWPGADPGVAKPQAQAGTLPPNQNLTLCAGTRILGHVGEIVILESDVAGPVNEFMELNKDRMPPEQRDAIREDIIKKQLKNVIQTKLVFLDAKRTIPSENWPSIEKQVGKMFEEVEFDRLMKRVGARNRQDLDEKLRKLGTSIEHERQAFLERELCSEWLRKQIKHDDEITYDQMVAYYRKHPDEFTTPARVKWEELMVRSLKYPSDEAAYAALAQMGNAILRGASFADVARQNSDGPTAGKGGAWDWTNKGSLVSKEIDEALFAIPVGQMSAIIKGPNGYHIIRVTARDDVKVAPFLEAQVDIRLKIVKERSEKQFREYLAKLESRIPVSTIYDGQRGEKEEVSQQPYGPTRR